MTQRAQSNLLAVGVALILITTTTTLGLAMADMAFAEANRPVEDRRVAIALSERLIAPDSAITERANVINESRIVALDGKTLAERFPIIGDRSVRIRLGDRTILERGTPTGQSISRIVLISTRRSVTREPTHIDSGVTIPRRTDRISVTIDPPAGSTVTTIRLGDRVVRYNESGLEGTYTVSSSRYRTVRLSVVANGPLPPGSVTVTYHPLETTKVVMVVTVGE